MVRGPTRSVRVDVRDCRPRSRVKLPRGRFLPDRHRWAPVGFEEVGVMASRVKKLVRPVDLAQQKMPFIGFPYAVMKKFGDDKAGMLTALIAYYGFLSLFPLLLVLFTVLGLVAGNDPSIEHKVTHSALSQFPIIGNQLGSNIHALNKSGPVALIIGLAGLLWGAQGVSQA